jgi:hypothetical protein
MHAHACNTAAGSGSSGSCVIQLRCPHLIAGGSRLPENGCAGLRAGHIVDAVLHDQVAVGAADGQRAAGATLANYDADDRHAQPKHLTEVVRNGLTLQGVGAGGREKCTRDVTCRDSCTVVLVVRSSTLSRSTTQYRGKERCFVVRGAEKGDGTAGGCWEGSQKAVRPLCVCVC